MDAGQVIYKSDGACYWENSDLNLKKQPAGCIFLGGPLLSFPQKLCLMPIFGQEIWCIPLGLTRNRDDHIFLPLFLYRVILEIFSRYFRDLWRSIGSKRRAANRVHSFHVPEFPQLDILPPRADSISDRWSQCLELEDVWTECRSAAGDTSSRLGTDAQKAITQRLETVGTKWTAAVWETTLTMLEGPIPASSLTSRRCFGTRFPELFKGELAWSGDEWGG